MSLTLPDLAREKRLPEGFLRRLGVRGAGLLGVAIPYRGLNGSEVRLRYRTSLDGPNRFKWGRAGSGKGLLLYGVENLRDLPASEPVLLVEGESDAWTGWHWGIDGVVGIPGKSAWQSEWASYLTDRHVYLWMEPDAEDLVHRVAADIPSLLVVRALSAIKDLSAAHLLGHDIPTLLRDLMAKAVPAREIPPPPRITRSPGVKRAGNGHLVLPASANLRKDIEGLVTRGRGLTEVFAPDRFLALLPAVGPLVQLPVTASLDRKFTCPVHEDRHGDSATLWIGKQGAVVVTCWHTGMWWSIPDLYAFRKTGILRHLRQREHRLWALRLLMDAEVLLRPNVALPALPRLAGTWKNLVKVYDALGERIACDLLTGPAEFMFTKEFAAYSAGLVPPGCSSEEKAAIFQESRMCIETLADFGILVREKPVKGPNGHMTWLYVPGTEAVEQWRISSKVLGRIARYAGDNFFTPGISQVPEGPKWAID